MLLPHASGIPQKFSVNKISAVPSDNLCFEGRIGSQHWPGCADGAESWHATYQSVGAPDTERTASIRVLRDEISRAKWVALAKIPKSWNLATKNDAKVLTEKSFNSCPIRVGLIRVGLS